ncbi:hypothetical protein C900_00793 [Fulvivirga imtechensis AK7]|uniref:Right handed beta helix domain-containing protein n=1 Tax=Fulvivirga imtechensis AK7 TaxID=1237149 RepID=L8K037_9BACT|nr:choice-of-anchor Q domain-containing protein [Fulvivirga imtechensis]ELR72832.1 hypothetical protein C900_00793 [Fulvivirga imtechensis AK7]
MKHLSAVILLLAAFWACTPEEEKLTYDSSAFLRFSTDTVYFDTVFTTVNQDIKNITRRLKVYNDSKNALKIEHISLRKPTSPYTIYVNGKTSGEFESVRLLGKDSLLILVQVAINPKDTNQPFIVTDEITFLTNGNKQDVKLVAWGQDAHFLKDSVLACNTTWTNDKPYVIFNSVLVDTLCSLTIEPGAKIYSHLGSYVFVKGTIDVQGEANNRVLFSNDRLDLKNAPGQWGGIIFLPGSKANLIEYADIRNAEVGIYLGTPDDDTDPDLIIGNSTIENIGGNDKIAVNGGLVLPGYGLLAITSDLYAYNTLINNCAINTVGNYAGGNYRYEHCTFANFSYDFFREDPAAVFSDNLVINNDALLVSDIRVDLVNTIIWGNLRDEILLSNGGEAAFTLNMTNNLLKSTNAEFDMNNNILNKDPKFFDSREYQYILDTLSPAKDAGIDIGVATDHNGSPRDAQPDIGAFERIEN